MENRQRSGEFLIRRNVLGGPPTAGDERFDLCDTCLNRLVSLVNGEISTIRETVKMTPWAVEKLPSGIGGGSWVYVFSDGSQKSELDMSDDERNRADGELKPEEIVGHEPQIDSKNNCGASGLRAKVDVGGPGMGIFIGFAGYGDAGSADGHGIPVMIESRDGIPYVLIWADINNEDPTHEISLANAAESKRN